MQKLLFFFLALLTLSTQAQTVQETKNSFPSSVLPLISYQYNPITGTSSGSSSGSITHIAAPITYTPATQYYVDGGVGSDANAGDINHPWKTLDPVNSHAWTANQGVYFKRGYSYAPTGASVNKGLYLYQKSGTPSQPIVIGSYGPTTAALPNIMYCSAPTDSCYNRNVIYFYQSANIIVDGVQVSDPTLSLSDNVRAGEARWGYALNIDNGGDSTKATGVIVQNCDFSLVGVGMEVNGFSTIVRNNKIHHLRMAKDHNTSGDYGANGIVLATSNNSITDNDIYECWAKDSYFTYDGGALETFSNGLGCSRNQILRNYTYNNQGFTEVGGSHTTDIVKDNVVAYNTIINSGKTVLFQGGNTFGATTSNFQLYNNTIVINTVQAYNTTNTWWFAISNNNGSAGTLSTSNLLIAKNNIFYINNLTWNITSGTNVFTSSQFTHSNNVVHLGSGGVLGAGWNYNTTDDTVRTGTVLFSNTTSSNAYQWDFTPAAASPEINFGSSLSYTQDLWGNTLTGNPDAGAIELVSGGATTATDALLDGTDFIWRGSFLPTGKSAYLELVASGDAGVTVTGTLYTQAGVAVSGSAAVASTTTTIGISPALNLVDGTTYQLKWKTSGTGNGYLKAARIVIR